MLGKIVAMLLAVVVAFSLVSAASAEISKSEAEKIAAAYTYEGEYAEANGLLMGREISYEGTPYYEIVFFRNESGLYVGSVIVSAETGEIVKDNDTINKIVYVMVRNQGPDFSSEGLETTQIAIQDFRTSEANLKTSLEWLIFLEEEGGLTWNTIEQAKTAESSLGELIADTRRLGDIGEEIYQIQETLTERLEVEKVNDFIAKNDEFVEYLNTTYTENIKTYKMNYTIFMDQLISDFHTKQYHLESVYQSTKEAELEALEGLLLEKDHIIKSWEREKVWVEEGHFVYGLYGVNKIARDMNARLEAFQPTPSPAPSPEASKPEAEYPIPGFEALLALAGLLSVAYLSFRKRKWMRKD